MDREREKSNVGRKKAKKTKKTKKMKKPEMKDLMVGRRMASLNASAMMQVLTIGIKISIIHPGFTNMCICVQVCMFVNM